MFKKTTSRDPEKPTVASELRKEFGWIMKKTEEKAVGVIERNPRPVFLLMIAILLVGIVLRLTVFSGPIKSGLKNQAVIQPAFDELKHNSIDSTQSSVEVLRMLIELRSEVLKRLSKPRLTKEDSVFVIKAEEAIRKIQHEKN